jgi:hypothetical protein
VHLLELTTGAGITLEYSMRGMRIPQVFEVSACQRGMRFHWRLRSCCLGPLCYTQLLSMRLLVKRSL